MSLSALIERLHVGTADVGLQEAALDLDLLHEQYMRGSSPVEAFHAMLEELTTTT